MRRKMEQMQSGINEFLGHVRQELERANQENLPDRIQQALVKLPPTQMVKAER
jgi:hypothetical protein